MIKNMKNINIHLLHREVEAEAEINIRNQEDD